ncbi:MAG: signal peptidase [Planctomycetes bacterium]|nr:signal peptidase [Planctomycetota bacterium]
MPSYRVTVRYGLMAATENFRAESGGFRVGDEVIVKTARGIDIGIAMSKAQPAGPDEETQGELLRIANHADRSIIGHIRESKEPEEFATCQECIRERNLPMRLVGVEHLFSGDKIIFYFMAENRVDFRELVKELARRYRTRIEMRQIGVRDEARLLADYEHCGRELCCRTFIQNLKPVTMRMAKMQKTTLDPSKISGHCGRLMCCLRFEDEVYSVLQADMPSRGAICFTENLAGEVLSVDLFKREILLQLPDGGQEIVNLADIKEIQGRRGGKPGALGAFQGRADAGMHPNSRFSDRDCVRRQDRTEKMDEDQRPHDDSENSDMNIMPETDLGGE